MPAHLIPRTALTGLLLGTAAAGALALAPVAAAADTVPGGQDLAPVPGAQDPDGPLVPDDTDSEDDDGVAVLDIPEGLLCQLLGTCDDGGDAPDEDGADGADDTDPGDADLPAENCDWVHTPFGKIWICDDDPPPPPENCQYLLDLNGDWALECDDTPPPPEDCQYLLGLDGNWVLDCGDDTPPPECEGEDCDPGFDPCEDPEDGPTPVGCEEEPEDTPRDGGKPGLPLTGPAAVLSLLAVGGLLAATGGTTLLLTRRRARNAGQTGDPVTEATGDAAGDDHVVE